jgi:hypothetical protein
MALQLTLLDLVQAVSESAASEAAVVATVVHLVNSGIVQLCGQIRQSKGVFAPIAIYQLAVLPVTTGPIGNRHTCRRSQCRTDRGSFEDTSITEGCPVARKVLLRRPGMSAHELRARAWHSVGIDVATASRLAREHARLQPCADGRQPQMASDVLDLDERARLMRRIAAYYGRCYAAAPDQLLWAGFAAIAVNDGVRPATELAMTIAEFTRLAGSLAPLLRARLRSLAWAAEDGIKCAFETNYAIFADLGWVHMVFLEEGIEALRELCQKGEIGRELLSGFEDIARGARIGGDAGHRATVRGNLALFRHEQEASATPVFARYWGAVAIATAVGLITVPNRKLAARGTSLGRSPDWTNVNSTEDSYGPFSTRWRWLVNSAWEPAVALHRDRRERACRLLDTEVTRAIEGLPERRHAWPWRRAVSLARVASLPTRGASRLHGPPCTAQTRRRRPGRVGPHGGSRTIVGSKEAAVQELAERQGDGNSGRRARRLGVH